MSKYQWSKHRKINRNKLLEIHFNGKKLEENKDYIEESTGVSITQPMLKDLFSYIQASGMMPSSFFMISNSFDLIQRNF